MINMLHTHVYVVKISKHSSCSNFNAIMNE